MTLPAAAERMPAAIDRYLLPGSRLQQAVDVIVNRWDRQTDGQTDGKTPDRYILCGQRRHNQR